MDIAYDFIHVPKKEYFVYTDKDFQELLMKWSMKGNLKLQTYCFNQPFPIYNNSSIIEDFFRSPVVTSSLECFCNDWKPVGTPALDVIIKQVPCTVTSMSFFDPILEDEKGIVRGQGWITKCLEYNVDGFYVFDELRKMLLDRESETYEMFTEYDREQFAFKLFKHLCIGGQWCQYEDNINTYLNTTRQLYKDLVKVKKDSMTKELMITSLVFQVVAKDKDGIAYFPRDPENFQNFAYLVVDPMERYITTITHQYGAPFHS